MATVLFGLLVIFGAAPLAAAEPSAASAESFDWARYQKFVDWLKQQPDRPKYKPGGPVIRDDAITILETAPFLPRTDARNCSTVRKLDDSLGPVRDQDGTGWCWAFATADLFSFKLKIKVSAFDVALNCFMLTSHGGSLLSEDWGDAPETKDDDLDAPFSNIPAQVIRIYAKVGYCSEDYVRSDHLGWKTIPSNEPGYVYKQEIWLTTLIKEVEGAGKNRDPAALRVLIKDSISKMFPYLSMEAAVAVIVTKGPKDYFPWFAFIEGAGGVRKQMPELHYSFALVNSEGEGQGALPIIDRELNKGNIVCIRFSSAFAFGIPGGQRLYGAESRQHYALLVGRQFNPTTKQCEYLVRNSWGDNNDGKLAWRSDPYNKGYFWMTETQLKENVGELTYLN